MLTTAVEITQLLPDHYRLLALCKLRQRRLYSLHPVDGAASPDLRVTSDSRGREIKSCLR